VSRDFATWLQRIAQAIGSGIVLRFREEPVLTVGVFRAAVTTLVGFGLGWTGEQVALTVILFEAFTAWVARREVTSVASPNLRIGTVVNEKSGEPTGIVVAQER